MRSSFSLLFLAACIPQEALEPGAPLGPEPSTSPPVGATRYCT